VRIGLLFDYPQADSGEAFDTAVRLGLGDGPPVEIVRELAHGLPGGSADEVVAAFGRLVDAGCDAIVGPSISDNCAIARDLADAARVPCVNYSGGAFTRSEWMFHYQVGSLEEEPVVMAEHLVARGLTSIAVLHDRSAVGEGYVAHLPRGLDVTSRAAIAPLAERAVDEVGRARDSEPAALVYLGLGVVARTVALAVAELGWDVPVVCNSALMFGYARRDWRAGWEGWTYVDTVADDNAERLALAARSKATAAGPVGVAGYDIARMLREAMAWAPEGTRAGLRDGLEHVKRLPAATGHDGTRMGFGPWDHGALKGDYLVLRAWRDGRTVQLAR
jgi:ABC-type branched-subunit amino acid transport system substrate-binding protein